METTDRIYYYQPTLCYSVRAGPMHDLSAMCLSPTYCWLSSANCKIIEPKTFIEEHNVLYWQRHFYLFSQLSTSTTNQDAACEDSLDGEVGPTSTVGPAPMPRSSASQQVADNM